MAKYSSQILELARKGAQHRYQELKAEMSALVKSFPHVAQNARVASPGRAETKNVVRRRRSMSASARRAVSERMKKFWAARRAAKKQ